MKLAQQALAEDTEIEDKSDDEGDDNPDYKEHGLNSGDEVEVVGSDEDVNLDNLTTAEIIDKDNDDDEFFTLRKFNHTIDNMGGGAATKQHGEKRHRLEATSFPAGQRSQTRLGCQQRRLKMSSVATIRIGNRTRTGNDVSGASRVIC